MGGGAGESSESSPCMTHVGRWAPLGRGRPQGTAPGPACLPQPVPGSKAPRPLTPQHGAEGPDVRPVGDFGRQGIEAVGRVGRQEQPPWVLAGVRP
jgi:hypothetical protein